MKAYILLGDDVFLERFNTVSPAPGPAPTCQSSGCLVWTERVLVQHYSAIMKYISQPPLLLNVHMHNPTVSVRSWMDSLLAFFPGLQVTNTPVHRYCSRSSCKVSFFIPLRC